MQRESTSLDYIPALDGLRGLGMLAVMAYHFEVSGYHGGLLSIDLFYVLSGFLITALLLHEHARSGTIGLGKFWSRRLRRLMPASLTMITAVAVWGWSQLPSGQLDRLRGDLLAMAGYVANWRFIVTGQSYFDVSGQPSVVRHAWSLAVEEQYYLVWPLLVVGLLLLGRGRSRLLLAFSVVAATVSAVTMAVVYDPANPSRAYYGTDTRAAQILIGAVLAMVVAKGRTPRSRAVTESVGAASLAIVVAVLFTIEESHGYLFRGGYIAFSFVMVALIWAVSAPTPTTTGRLLSWRPLTAVGEISYGLYLWHWPVRIAVSEDRTPFAGWTLLGVRVAVTFLLAWLSFVLIETPVRHKRGWGVLGGWKSPVAVFGAVAIAVGTTVAATAGATPPPRYLAGEVGEIAEEGDVTGAGGSATNRVLMVGDSLVLSLSDGMAKASQERDWGFSAVARWGCGVLDLAPEDHICHREHEEYIDRILRAESPVIVWLSNRDNVLNSYVEPPVESGAWSGEFALLRMIDAVASRFTAAGSKVAFVLAPATTSPHEDPVMNAALARSRRVFRMYHFFHRDDTMLLDLSSAICGDEPRCPTTVDGVVLRPEDGVHYGPEGSYWVANWMFDQLASSDIVATNQSSSQPK